MKINSIFLSLALTLCAANFALSQQPKQDIYVAPNAPKDKPFDIRNSQVQQLEEAIKPYIEKARSTYPEAKARFLSGLPAKHTFFITTRLVDSSKRFEQVFIAVRQIKDGKISGVIASEINLVSDYTKGDSYSFPETELIDWTISKPDGTEEGNFVGKFLDSYQVTHVVGNGVWKNQPVTPARMNERIEEWAVKFGANAPIERIVFYDIGYPNGEKEYASLDGNAVLLLTSISQTRDELPLQKVYVVSEGKEVELQLLKVVLAELDPNNAASAKTFGRFRADALYLLPMSLRTQNVDLLADFQANRKAFKVTTFGNPLPDDLKLLVSIKPSGTGPSQTALEAFVKREYPSFFQN